MSAPDPRLTRYLLGELSEAEMTTLERDYMSDPAAFAQLVESETDLVDDYIRGRLPTEVRRRFEEHYLSHPKRRERVALAGALAAKIHERDSRAPASRAVQSWSGAIAGFRAGWTGRIALATAMATLLLSTGWFAIQRSRLRGELARTERARAVEEQRARELEGQLSRVQTKAREPASELERLKTPAAAPAATAPSSTPTFVSLLLTVPSARAPETGPASTLIIPPGTGEVRVQLEIGEVEYASYQVSVSRVAGPVVFTRQGVAPRKVGGRAHLAVTVPADRLTAGDYMLTLNGERPGAGLEVVSQLLFRVSR
jgi:hypothetical protein